MKLVVLGATGGTGLEVVRQAIEHGHCAAVESTAFLFKDSFLPPAHLIGKLFFPITVADASMEQIIGKSGLDWTIVRAHLGLPTSRGPVTIVCEKGISPVSVLPSRAQTWPIS